MLEKLTGLKLLGMAYWRALAKVYVVEDRNKKYLMKLLGQAALTIQASPRAFKQIQQEGPNWEGGSERWGQSRR